MSGITEQKDKDRETRIQDLETRRSLCIQCEIQLMREQHQKAGMVDEITEAGKLQRIEAWNRSWMRGKQDISMARIHKIGLTKLIEMEKKGSSLEDITAMHEQVRQQISEDFRKHNEEMNEGVEMYQPGDRNITITVKECEAGWKYRPR